MPLPSGPPRMNMAESSVPCSNIGATDTRRIQERQSGTILASRIWTTLWSVAGILRCQGRPFDQASLNSPPPPSTPFGKNRTCIRNRHRKLPWGPHCLQHLSHPEPRGGPPSRQAIPRRGNIVFHIHLGCLAALPPFSYLFLRRPNRIPSATFG